MKKLALLALLLSSLANAQTPVITATVKWANVPTVYPDGTPFPLSDIAHVTIAWLTLSGGTKLNGTLTAPVAPSTINVSTTCGSYVFSGTYTTTSTAHVPNATSLPATATYATGVACPAGVQPAAPTLQGAT
jgi:hypothetical protein